MDTRTYRGIGNSLAERAALMSELAGKLAKQEKADSELKKILLEKAPKKLRGWIKAEGVLDILFTYGKYDTKIRFYEYGFVSVADARTKMRALGKAWEDVVTIALGEPDGTPQPYRIPVVLTAML